MPAFSRLCSVLLSQAVYYTLRNLTQQLKGSLVIIVKEENHANRRDRVAQLINPLNPRSSVYCKVGTREEEKKNASEQGRGD